MRQQVADGDVGAIRALPCGNVLADAIVEAEHAALDLLHGERRGREHLGQRRQVEDRVVCRRRRGRLVAEASECPAPEGPGRVADFNDRRGKRLLPDSLLEYRDRRDMLPSD